jgi:alcohol dehydrogenase class IV
VHALALPLGGRCHLPHGVITGTFVGALVRFNGPVAAADHALLATALGWGPLDSPAFARRLDRLAESIGLTAVLRATAVPAAVVPALAREAVANRRLMDPNPRPVSVEDAVAIYESVLALEP